MKFSIANMTCGGCARGVTATIKSVDPEAEVEIDVVSKQVEVKSTYSFDALAAALTEDGFPPQAI